MASTFGKTWWGEQWLQSLNDIDYSNRLPRGATYARQGAVLSISYKGNEIKAKVQGSRRTPYSERIVLPKFSEKDVDKLVSLIVRQPVVLSKLLNRQLDRSLVDMAEKAGLQLFPKRWSDWDMNCSCPDWAVPCKHLAAVIYQLSKEIDNNPFLVFSLHGVDLLQELERRGIAAVSQQMMEVEPIESVFGNSQLKVNVQGGAMPDYSSLPELSSALSDLLPASPAFCLQGDFKETYKKDLNTIVKRAKNVLDGKLRLDEVPTTSDGEEDDPCGPALDGDSLQSLLDIEPNEVRNGNSLTLAWRSMLLCALQLVARGCIVPQIYSKEEQNVVRKKVTTHLLYRIVWQPAMLDEATAAVVSRLGQPVQLLNRFITRLIALLYRLKSGTLYENLFFSSLSYAFDEIGETNVPGGIRSWLDRYYIQNKYALTFKIAECELEEGLEDAKKGRQKGRIPRSSQLKSPANTPQFAVDVWVDNRPLSEIMSSEDAAEDAFAVLQQLAVLCDIIDGLSEYINSKGTQSILYNRHTFVPFLMNVVPAVRLLGVNIVMPRSLQSLIRPNVTVSLRTKSQDGVAHLSLNQMLDFDWRVAVGDVFLSPEEFEKMLGRASGLLRFKERYIYLDEASLQKLRHALDTPPRLKASDLLQAAFCGDYMGVPVELSEELREKIRQYSTDIQVPLPHDLQAQLRPYQVRGYSWMYRNMKLGFGSIIADDMGLGKTLQVIALLQKLKEEGEGQGSEGEGQEPSNLQISPSSNHPAFKSLVVVPTGLLSNWQSEVARFAPRLRTAIYHGPSRSLSDAEVREVDILLTTYGVVRMDAAKLKKQTWSVVVVDEAQNIKNSDTAQSKAIRSLSANHCVAMSGTPVENRLSEYWSIMDFVNSGYLGTLKDFKTQYATPIQQDGNQRVAERFKKVTAPFMLRRLKTDKSIISDLPDKIVRNELAALSPEQAALYQETLESCMAVIEGITDDDAQSLFKRKGLILQMILALKQICNHPAQYLKDSNTDVALSGKAVMLVDMLRSILDANEKVLVFTQFKEMGAILSGIVSRELHVTPMFYHGGCTLKQREEMVSRFQNDPDDRIFILSLKAAGTGLNLTAATHVIHYDLWWNPAVEAQATDRAYRIGQHKNVQVHRFITQKTFEEQIDAMIQKKKNLADMTVSTGENWIGQLSNQELREILRLQ